jgi:ubiquinone/menaquinone biosynthesis C-methylase UbiE
LAAALSMTVGRGAVARLAAQLAELSPHDAVVDVGCGPGTAARLAARAGASVVGVDPAGVMLRVARVIPSRGSVTWLVGSAEDLPVPGDSATVAWSLACVHHWADVDAGLREVHRVLSPGGRFVALERATTHGATGLGSHGWEMEQAEAFAEALRGHGFEEVEVSARHAGRTSVIGVRARRQEG